MICHCFILLFWYFLTICKIRILVKFRYSEKATKKRKTYPSLFWQYFGAKCLVFVSSCSLKTRELSFAQFVYFLRKVCLFFSFWMITFTIMFFWHNCNWAKLSSLLLRKREETKTRYFAPLAVGSRIMQFLAPWKSCNNCK